MTEQYVIVDSLTGLALTEPADYPDDPATIVYPETGRAMHLESADTPRPFGARARRVDALEVGALVTYGDDPSWRQVEELLNDGEVTTVEFVGGDALSLSNDTLVLVWVEG